MKEPCYCGATDCKRCHPENFKIIECKGCGTKILFGAFLEEYENWYRVNANTFLCEDCYKKYMED